MCSPEDRQFWSISVVIFLKFAKRSAKFKKITTCIKSCLDKKSNFFYHSHFYIKKYQVVLSKKCTLNWKTQESNNLLMIKFACIVMLCNLKTNRASPLPKQLCISFCFVYPMLTSITSVHHHPFHSVPLNLRKHKNLNLATWKNAPNTVLITTGWAALIL